MIVNAYEIIEREESGIFEKTKSKISKNLILNMTKDFSVNVNGKVFIIPHMIHVNRMFNQSANQIEVNEYTDSITLVSNKGSVSLSVLDYEHNDNTSAVLSRKQVDFNNLMYLPEDEQNKLVLEKMANEHFEELVNCLHKELGFSTFAVSKIFNFINSEDFNNVKFVPDFYQKVEVKELVGEQSDETIDLTKAISSFKPNLVEKLKLMFEKLNKTDSKVEINVKQTTQKIDLEDGKVTLRQSLDIVVTGKNFNLSIPNLLSLTNIKKGEIFIEYRSSIGRYENIGSEIGKDNIDEVLNHLVLPVVASVVFINCINHLK